MRAEFNVFLLTNRQKYANIPLQFIGQFVTILSVNKTRIFTGLSLCFL